MVVTATINLKDTEEYRTYTTDNLQECLDRIRGEYPETTSVVLVVSWPNV